MTTDKTQMAKVIAAHFVEQGNWCRQLGSEFTADLIGLMAKDYAAGGPVAKLFADRTTDPRADALALRLCGALHGAALTGRAPALAAAYPTPDRIALAADIWPLAHDLIENDMDWVHAYLKYAPQTNEPARSIALLPGFLRLAADFGLPMNLLELGASAGLNQNWDKFSYKTENWERAGRSDVLISTNWTGCPPDNLDAVFDISDRAGCDLNPLNIHDPAACLRLRSYIWPDQSERLARFDAALALAQSMQTKIDKANAAQWLTGKLANRPDNQLTIIYHSVFLQYPPIEEIRLIMSRIREAGQMAHSNAPIAWLCFEPEALFESPSTSPKMITRLQTWPTGDIDICGTSNGHATWFNASAA